MCIIGAWVAYMITSAAVGSPTLYELPEQHAAGETYTVAVNAFGVSLSLLAGFATYFLIKSYRARDVDDDGDDDGDNDDDDGPHHGDSRGGKRLPASAYGA